MNADPVFIIGVEYDLEVSGNRMLELVLIWPRLTSLPDSVETVTRPLGTVCELPVLRNDKSIVFGSCHQLNLTRKGFRSTPKVAPSIFLTNSSVDAT